jgi:hypothetical protein
VGFVGSLFSNTNGAGFQGQQANIQTPTTTQQAQNAYGQSQDALSQQAAFVQALQAQGSIPAQGQALGAQQNLQAQLQGQNAVGNQNQAFLNQSQLYNALSGQNGVGNQSAVFNQQQSLANQLQGMANGTGPNPALAQLNQQTGNNIAAQSALMAGQRGSSANAGLIAREAAQQGAGIQQQAIGQGATLAAQQQIAGAQALGAQQQALANTAGQQIGQQTGVGQALFNNGAQQVGQLQGQNQAVANQANTQVGQQQGALQGYTNAAQGEQGQLLNSIAQSNNAQVSSNNNVNTVNEGIAKGNQGFQSDVVKSGTQAIGQGLAMALAKGGEVPGPKSAAGKHLKGHSTPMKASHAPIDGEKQGTKPIPGKAAVKGDSFKNDKVQAVLSPGEVVIPRSVMNSKDPAGNAAKFVQAVMAKHQMKKSA